MGHPLSIDYEPLNRRREREAEARADAEDDPYGITGALAAYDQGHTQTPELTDAQRRMYQLVMENENAPQDPHVGQWHTPVERGVPAPAPVMGAPLDAAPPPPDPSPQLAALSTMNPMAQDQTPVGAPSAPSVAASLPPAATEQAAMPDPSAQGAPSETSLTTERSREMQTHEMLGVPPAVSGMTHQTAQLHPFAGPDSDQARLDDARSEDRGLQGFGGFLMGIGNAMSGPRGLPDRGALMDQIQGLGGRGAEVERDLARTRKQPQPQRAAQDHSAEQAMLRERLAAQHEEGQLDRRNRLIAARMAQGHQDTRAAGAEAGRMARADLREQDRMAIERMRHPVRTGGGGGGLSREDAVAGYVARQAENWRASRQEEPTPEQRAEWATQANGMRTSDLSASGRTHEARVGARPTAGPGSAAAATDAAATARQGALDARMQAKLAHDLDTTGITTLRSRLDAADAALAGASDQEIQAAIGVMTHPTALAVAPARVQRIAQSITAIQNAQLRNVSGAAVTDQELERFRAEMGTGSMLSAGPVRRALHGLRAMTDAREAALRAGSGAAAPAAPAGGGMLTLRNAQGATVQVPDTPRNRQVAQQNHMEIVQ